MSYRILENKALASGIFEMTVEAPAVARKAHAGQFFIVRACEHGERVPFTFSDWSADEGWIRFIFMRVGKTTHLLSHMTAGESVQDIAGPLGHPTPVAVGKPWGADTSIAEGDRLVVVGGGVGTAVAYPVARAAVEAGTRVTVIVGARTSELLILQRELAALDLEELIVVTDDGSAGRTGLVTEPLRELCEAGAVDRAFVVGPAIMMRFAAATTAECGTTLPTLASLNPIMIDGTGMCGACRIQVGGVTKFGCVDGPDFDAHLVDWEELATRQRVYLDYEQIAATEYERGCGCHG
ncbi:MAG: sulfide/dihydroorotate dehydrogenase-like FAD/NAD-binding protein [Coriobacteriia bacterium]|nr:sulfide/dihydroorotate dehydrogenase-like FAD/NAD-binding protein [Coriobacteriia bacterium]